MHRQITHGFLDTWFVKQAFILTDSIPVVRRVRISVVEWDVQSPANADNEVHASNISTEDKTTLDEGLRKKYETTLSSSISCLLPPSYLESNASVRIPKDKSLLRCE